MQIGFFISLVGLLLLFVNCIRFNLQRKNKDILYNTLRIYLMLLFVVELACHIIGYLRPYSNFFLSHYYFIFQFIALSLFFYQLFLNPLLKKFVLFSLIIVLAILGFQYYNAPELYWEFNMVEIGLTSFILIFYALLFLINTVKEPTHYYFYFCSGLIFYLTSSSIIFLSGNTDLVLFTKPFFFDIWIFNSLFYILYQFLIYKEWKLLILKPIRKSEEVKPE